MARQSLSIGQRAETSAVTPVNGTVRAEVDLDVPTLRDLSAVWRVEILGSTDGGQSWRVLVGSTDHGRAGRTDPTWVTYRSTGVDGMLLKAVVTPLSKDLSLGVSL